VIPTACIIATVIAAMAIILMIPERHRPWWEKPPQDRDGK
jgi:hypothetical protein